MSVVFPHQVVNMSLREIDCIFCVQSNKALILGPIILRVRIPIHRELGHEQKTERFLLLNLVVNVQECLSESVVCHRVTYRFSHQPEVECLVTP
jgi:hypothetical protein